MASPLEPNQYTVKRAVSCCGVGLHTGRTVNLTISPAPENSGIQFVRTDVEGHPVIPARVERVVDTTLATTLGDGEHRISTTEHLLAALRACGIDNAFLEIDSHETPIMDGSAGPFMRLLKSAGRQRQRSLRKVMRITKTISFADGEKTIRVEPCDVFKVTGRIKFDDALISEQRYSVVVDRERFAKEIATARTFGFVEQVEQLWQNGLALGGTLENVIAIHWNRKSILNEDGLRFNDEFIRHKVLDIIGDMTLLGSPLLGHVMADRSGHGLHLGLMQNIIANPQCWEYVTLEQHNGSLLQHVVDSTQQQGNRFAPFFAPVRQNLRSPQPCAL